MHKRKINSRENDPPIENKNLNRFIIATLIFVLITLILASTYLFKDKIENFINYSFNEKALPTTIDDSGLRIHFIDVGQADATLIQFPTGEVMLIDCGDSIVESHSKFVSYLSSIDFAVDESTNEKIIDYLILTHPDKDHIGGASYIFDNFKVEVCIRPDVYASNETLPFDTSLIVQSQSDTYADVISKLEVEITDSGCISLKSVQSLELKSNGYENSLNPLDWILNFYAPITTELPYRLNQEDNTNLAPISNDYSPIMILTYMDRKIMFTGDASDSVEKDFIDFYKDSGMDFDVDILKLGHHGSRYSTCEEFLEFTTPEYAIASAGLANQHGHPSTYTLERLEEFGVLTYNIYRTDLNGNIIFGISQIGAFSLNADYVQYSTIEFKWWQLYLISTATCACIIYIPVIVQILSKIHPNKKIKTKVK
jgi:competence protein ComEC